MDAWAIAITAVANMITEICRGQSAEQRRLMWEWFIEDQKFWRDAFKAKETK